MWRVTHNISPPSAFMMFTCIRYLRHLVSGVAKEKKLIWDGLGLTWIDFGLSWVYMTPLGRPSAPFRTPIRAKCEGCGSKSHCLRWGRGPGHVAMPTLRIGGMSRINWKKSGAHIWVQPHSAQSSHPILVSLINHRPVTHTQAWDYVDACVHGVLVKRYLLSNLRSFPI